MNITLASEQIKKQIKRQKRRDGLITLSFLAPNLIGFLVFTIIPVIATVVISMTEWNLIADPQWIGFKNYASMFGTKRFLKSLNNTFLYTVFTVPIGLFLALCLAVLMNRKIHGISVYRTIYYLPVVSSTVAVALLWKYIYADNVGILAGLFKYMGLESPKWISSTKWALPSVMIMSVWKGLGYNIVLLLAGLQGISQTYYEAAKIDGANGWRQFTHITIPLITPTLFFLVIMSIISSFQVFEQTQILTEGGPGFASTTIVYYIYTSAFVNLKFGFACALAMFLFLIILIITIIQWIGQKKWVTYDAY